MDQQQGKSYANSTGLQLYLNQITPSSTKIEVCNFWQNMLDFYFSKDNLAVQYGTWAPLTSENSQQRRVPFLVVKRQNHDFREQVFVECKRLRADGEKADGKAWENARVQLEMDMHIWQTQYQVPHPSYYGLISIGAEVRFFIMNRRCCDKLEPLHGDPRSFSLNDDAIEVHDNMKEICEKILED